VADLAIRGDRIAAIGELDDSMAATVIDASGKAVSRGFINMMAWSVIDLVRDGRGMSDLTQGITLEVFGEGSSMGPLTPAMKADFPKYWDGVEAQWTTLGEYLEFLEQRGVSPNVASFIGATTPRAYVLGMDDVDPTPAQLAAMQELVREAMREDSDEWENMLTGAGPEAILLTGFRNPALQKYVGMTLAEVAAERGTAPEDTAKDLVIEDRSRVDAVFFTQSEKVVRRAVALPWTSFCTDAGAPAAEGEFLKNSTHPRAYGTFPRVLGHYVREEGLLSLAEAVRKASALPAENLSLVDRGRLAPGFYADVVVFDPETISDRATFEEPHQYSIGVEEVFVNGGHVIAGGTHTGAKPGRVVRGPGWIGWE